MGQENTKRTGAKRKGLAECPLQSLIADSFVFYSGFFRLRWRILTADYLSYYNIIMKPTAYSLRSTVSGLLAAFTLVELMVVVAIISILLMLLIPNIRTMREKAWSAQCQNNLRQYGIAMNQYMADHNGYFIYPGWGVGSGGATHLGPDGGWKSSDGNTFDAGQFDNRAVRSTAERSTGASRDTWQNMIRSYIPASNTLATLSAGVPSVRVCPVVLRELRAANYFDPQSPNFKGYLIASNTMDELTQSRDFGPGAEIVQGEEAALDFSEDNVTNDASIYLSPHFTTYAINPLMLYKEKYNIPENIVAFIDWNAREGWGANLSYTTWIFSFTNRQGVAFAQGDPKLPAGRWWLTEVGFHHPGKDNIYGAHYVAMDGHIGWVGSNAISRASFETGL